MTVQIACTECGVKIKAPPEAIGKRVRCPKCKQPFVAEPIGSAPKAKKKSKTAPEPKAKAEPKTNPEPAEKPKPSETIEARSATESDPLTESKTKDAGHDDSAAVSAAKPEPETKTKTEPKPETNSEGEAKQAAPEPVAEADPVTEPEPTSESEPESEPGSESDQESDQETEQETEQELDNELDKESEHEPEQEQASEQEPEPPEHEQAQEPEHEQAQESEHEQAPAVNFEAEPEIDSESDAESTPEKPSENEATSETNALDGTNALEEGHAELESASESEVMPDQEPASESEQDAETDPEAETSFESEPPIAAAISSAATVDAWTLRTPDGSDYGPITKAELNEWVAEDRVDRECQLLNAATNEWLPAADVYPHLENMAPPVRPTVAETLAKPAEALATPADVVPLEEQRDDYPNFDAADAEATSPTEPPPPPTGENDFDFGELNDSESSADPPTEAVETAQSTIPETGDVAVAALAGAGAAALVSDANPFESPAAQASSTGSATFGEFPVDLRNALAKTAPWCLLFAILLLLAAALMGLMSAVSVLGVLNSGLVALVPVVTCLLFTLLYGYLGVKLLNYSQACKAFSAAPQMESLTSAMTSQQKFWKAAGVVVLVSFLLGGLLAAVTVLLGLGASLQ